MGEEDPKGNFPVGLNWHGFQSHLDAAKALTWVIGLGWAAILFGLDPRYASKSVEGWARETYEVTLESGIENSMFYLCGSPDGERRRELNRRLQELVRKYQSAFGRVPYIPTCREAR